MKLEDDMDIHMVIAEPRFPARTMIVEFPLTSCVHRAPPARKRQLARASCSSPGLGSASSAFEPLSGTAVVTGVGFFDTVHGQTGVAPNGIELHSVLTFVSRKLRLTSPRR